MPTEIVRAGVKRYRNRQQIEAAQLLDTRQLPAFVNWITARGAAVKTVGYTEEAPTGVEINGSIHADVGTKSWVLFDPKTKRFNVLTPDEFDARFEAVPE